MAVVMPNKYLEVKILAKRRLTAASAFPFPSMKFICVSVCVARLCANAAGYALPLRLIQMTPDRASHVSSRTKTSMPRTRTPYLAVPVFIAATPPSSASILIFSTRGHGPYEYQLYYPPRKASKDLQVFGPFCQAC